MEEDLYCDHNGMDDGDIDSSFHGNLSREDKEIAEMVCRQVLDEEGDKAFEIRDEAYCCFGKKLPHSISLHYIGVEDGRRPVAEFYTQFNYYKNRKPELEIISESG